MPRPPSRLLIPTLALIALLFLAPTLATAFPQSATLRSAAELPEASPGFFSKLWALLSAVWATGSGLEPNGGTTASGTEPNGSSGGDTGSGLEPNG